MKYPESPVWIDLQKVKSGKPEPMKYRAIVTMLGRLFKRHNATTISNGKPTITKKIRTHLIRYYVHKSEFARLGGVRHTSSV